MAGPGTLLPSHGPVYGGTTVTVVSRNSTATANQNVTCVFGATAVNATLDVKSGYIYCVVPPGNEGPVSVTILGDSGLPYSWTFTYFGPCSYHC